MTGQPWDRWDHEPEVAYSAFCAYVQAGWPQGPSGLPAQRLLPVVARAAGRDAAWLRDCLHTWCWRDRAAAYDRAVRRAQDAAVADEAYDATRAQLQCLTRAESLTLNEIEKHLDASTSEGSVMSARDAIAMLEKLVRIRALIEGRPTEHVQIDHGVDLDVLTADELVELSALLAKGRRIV